MRYPWDSHVSGLVPAPNHLGHEFVEANSTVAESWVEEPHVTVTKCVLGWVAWVRRLLTTFNGLENESEHPR